MPANITNILFLALAWTAFFVIHSLLASVTVKAFIKKRLPNFFPFYRISYNVLSLVLLIPIFWFSHSIKSPLLWQWKGTMKIISTVIALLALAAFLLTLRYYDTAEFIGIKQIREKDPDSKGEGVFTLSPLHRYVRHPWYLLALLIIWTRNMDLIFFITAIAVTAYFIIGSRLEEGKLLLYYGKKYEKYLSAVPGIIPLPWRYMTKVDAEKLQKM
ncbi:MAG: hypothetical protein OEV42_10505 [Deltaproteobacteria bacterium]|nr:hypothetical protein [Deltaproteobacteria bacterium]